MLKTGCEIIRPGDSAIVSCCIEHISCLESRHEVILTQLNGIINILVQEEFLVTHELDMNRNSNELTS